MTHKSFAVVGVLVATSVFAGCASMDSTVRRTVDDYVAVAPNVNLGMTKAQVVELLQPSQSRLHNTDKRQPDLFRKEGVLVEILYFRSGWQNNEGFTTDDEFTPYVFKDGTLAAVGWITLGGPRPQAQARAHASENTTIWLLPIDD